MADGGRALEASNPRATDPIINSRRDLPGGMSDRAATTPSLRSNASSQNGPAPGGRRVLFVCEGNTFRSVLAQAFFNAARVPGWVSFSAGISRGEAISPAAIDLLRSDGLEPATREPRTLTREMIQSADLVVTFGCASKLPGGSPKDLVDWPVPGGFGRTEVERIAIRDEIRRRVAGLSTSLSSL